MKWASVCVFLVVGLTSWKAEGFRFNRFATNLRKSLIAPLVVLSIGASPVFAKDAQVYFGVGCFWHTSHELAEAEKSILGRSDDQLTSKTGYAGGNRVGKDGKVCYHNLQGVADYGSLGHGEVVGLDVPEDKIKDISKTYFSLFGSDAERPDKGDRGSEYRSLLGLPGNNVVVFVVYINPTFNLLIGLLLFCEAGIHISVLILSYSTLPS